MPKEYSLQQLAEYAGGRVEGDPSLAVCGFNGIEQAVSGELTFLLDGRQTGLLATCKASACIVPEGIGPVSLPVIISSQPAVAAARIHSLIVTEPFQARGIHPSSVAGKDCRLSSQITIGPLVCLGDRVILGERVTIHAGAVIGNDVVIGDDTTLHANVVIADRCTVGSRVILHHGVVVGSDGFGFATDAKGNHHTKPQVGIVRIDDDVQVGANSCIDRAAFGVTWIKQGARIDNLVMVGHNVVVGENSILVAQSGIAGSSTLGRNVVLAAKAGVAGHLHLGNQVMAAAMSGIHNDQPDGARVGGCPAIDVRNWGKSSVVFSRLPEMHKELRRLGKEVERLTKLLEHYQAQEGGSP